MINTYIIENEYYIQQCILLLCSKQLVLSEMYCFKHITPIKTKKFNKQKHFLYLYK